MRRCLLLIAATLLTAASNGPAPADWIVIRDAALGFSEAFPIAPKVATKVHENGVRSTSYVGGASGLTCLVEIGEYPDKGDPIESLTSERDSFVEGIHGVLGSTRRIEMRRGSTVLPASESTVSSDRAVYRLLTIVDGSRDYMVLGMAKKGGGREGEIEECLHGFTLLAR